MNKAQVTKSIQKGLRDGARFISFMYHSREGEIAVHTVLMGIDLARAYRRDLAVLATKIDTLSGDAHTACEELISSLKDSLENGIGNNRLFTQKGVYKKNVKGSKVHKGTNEYYIHGFLINKTVIKEGEHYTPKKSKPVTIEKNKIRDTMKSKKFRNYVLNCETIAGIKLNGNVLEIQVNN